MGHCKKERPICTYCGLIGHIAEKCYKLHGYPSRYKPKRGNNVKANQVFGNFGNLDVLAASNTHQINGGLPNVGLQSELVPTSQNTLSAPFGGVSLQPGPQPSLSQCPIS